MLRIVIAAFMAFSLWAAPARAQTDQNEANDASVRVVEEFIAVSRLPGLYANLLKSIELIATPELRALQQEAMDSVLTPKEDIALAQKVMTLFPLIAAAGTDLQSGFNENRTEMIRDAAELLKLILTEEQQEKLLAFLKLSSVRKLFDALYVTLDHPTSWTVEDSQTLARFERWTEKLEIAFARKKPPEEMLTAADVNADRLKAAQALVADAARVTRLEEIHDMLVPFFKDTILPRADWMSEIDRQEALAKLDDFGGDYGGVLREDWLANAPIDLAAALSSRQLQELHEFFKTETAVKVSDYIFKIVQSITSITGADIDELRAFMKTEEDLFAAADPSPEKRKAAELQLQGLGLKWLFTLSDSISPQTRDKLLAAWMSISMEALPR